MVQFPPAWVLPGAKFDFDFARSRYWGASVGVGSNYSNGYQTTAIIGTTANGPLYAPNRAGVLIPFSTSVTRITDLGLWAEADTTNIALFSRTFTNAVWTKTNVTASQNQVGADGVANSGTLLTATASNGTILQAITNASASVMTSFWMKRVSGTGTVKISQDNGSTFTDVTAQLNTTSFVQVQCAAYQTLTNPTVVLQLGTSGDSVIIDFAQCEIDNLPAGLVTYATNPMVTTTSTLRRYTEEPAIQDPTGNHPNEGSRIFATCTSNRNPWSAAVAFCSNPGTVNGSSPLISDGNINITMTSAGAVTAQGAACPGTATIGLGNINKVAVRVNGAGSTSCLNGGSLSSLGVGSGAFPIQTYPSGISHCGIGNNGAAQFPLNGYITRLTFFDRELLDGQLQEFSR